MKKYYAKWLEEHVAVVDAENEKMASDKAMEYAKSHDTMREIFDFEVEEEK